MCAFLQKILKFLQSFTRKKRSFTSDRLPYTSFLQSFTREKQSFTRKFNHFEDIKEYIKVLKTVNILENKKLFGFFNFLIVLKNQTLVAQIEYFYFLVYKGNSHFYYKRYQILFPRYEH